MALSPVSGYPTVSTTINCIYCKAVLSFSGLPAVRYADHLSQEHRIIFGQVNQRRLEKNNTIPSFQDEIITRTIKTQLKGLLPPSLDSPPRSLSSIVSCLVCRLYH